MYQHTELQTNNYQAGLVNLQSMLDALRDWPDPTTMVVQYKRPLAGFVTYAIPLGGLMADLLLSEESFVTSGLELWSEAMPSLTSEQADKLERHLRNFHNRHYQEIASRPHDDLEDEDEDRAHWRCRMCNRVFLFKILHQGYWPERITCPNCVTKSTKSLCFDRLCYHGEATNTDDPEGVWFLANNSVGFKNKLSLVWRNPIVRILEASPEVPFDERAGQAVFGIPGDHYHVEPRPSC